MENFFLYPIQWNVAATTLFQPKNNEKHNKERKNSKKEIQRRIQSTLKKIIVIEQKDKSTESAK